VSENAGVNDTKVLDALDSEVRVYYGSVVGGTTDSGATCGMEVGDQETATSKADAEPISDGGIGSSWNDWSEADAGYVLMLELGDDREEDVLSSEDDGVFVVRVEWVVDNWVSKGIGRGDIYGTIQFHSQRNNAGEARAYLHLVLRA